MYLDPGFGSLVVQAILGIVLAVPALLFAFRSRVSTFLRRFRKNGKSL